MNTYIHLIGLKYIFFRLNTGAKDISQGNYWSQSKPNTFTRAVYDNNMDDTSFHSSKYDALLKTLKLPKQAFAGENSMVMELAACKVNEFSCIIYLILSRIYMTRVGTNGWDFFLDLRNIFLDNFGNFTY